MKDFEEIGPPRGAGALALLIYTRVCTSLSDVDATSRLNETNPPGTSVNEWRLCTEEDQLPIACEDNPGTHRHLMFHC